MYVLFPYTHHTHSLSHPSSKEKKTLNILCVFTQCQALYRSQYQPSLTTTSVSICTSYISKSYTRHTRASRRRTSEGKFQGMYVLFHYTHHTHSLSHPSSKENKTLNILYVFTQCQALYRSQYQPSLTSTSVSICTSYISKSYTRHTRASRRRTSEGKTSRYVCSFSLYTPYALS